MQNQGNNSLKDYLKKSIGLTFKEKESGRDLLSRLPLYLKSSFSFSLAEIDEHDFLVLKPSDEIDLSTSRIVKFANQISKLTGKPTLILFLSLDSLRRRTLINNRMNFVVPNKQIYIPSLRMNLNESGSIMQFAKKEILTPSAQLLLLYFFQKTSLAGMPFKDIAKVLNYSQKTISLVVSELQKLSICEVELIDGRNKSLCFNKNGRELWDFVMPLMTSPVRQVWYIDKKNLPDYLPVYASYDTALAHYTFMASSSQMFYAIDKNVFSDHQKKLQPFLHPEEGDVCLEVWKYNPALLADGQFIDKLSMMLCYKDIDDERVRAELKKMENNITW